MTRARTLAVAWTLLILAACSVPGSSLPTTRLWEFDKLIHFALFAGLGWLWMRALKHTLGRRLALVIAAGIAYAVLTELYQGLLPWERRPDPYDALANSAGLLCAVALYAGIARRAITDRSRDYFGT